MSDGPDDFVVTSSGGTSTPLEPASPSPDPAGDAPPSVPPDVSPAPAPDAPEDEGDEPSPQEAARERNADGTFKPRKDSPQHRISHLTWEREEARRQAQAERERADKLHVELETYRRSQQATQAPQPPAPPRTAEGPQLSEFDDYDAYVDARAEWRAEQRLEAFKAEMREQSRLQAHEARLDAFAAATPDFVPMLQAAADLPISAAMKEAILTSPHGPALTYYLATHREEGLQLTQETASLPPSAAPMVRRFLERLISAPSSASSGPHAGSRPSVPAPLSPVGAAPVVADPPLESLPVDEYVERMNAREAKARMRPRSA